jgi:hypothetical protein
VELGAEARVQHLRESLLRGDVSGNRAFKILLKSMKPFNLAECFPGAACEYLRHFLTWHMADDAVDSEFIIMMLKEYGLDVNYNDPEYGTLVHVISHRHYLASVPLFDQLNQMFGEKLLLEQKAKRDPAPYWSSNEDKRVTTPLQIAIEMNFFRLATRLIQNFASTEGLDLTKLHSISYDSDGQFYQLIQTLRLAGVPELDLKDKVEELKRKYRDSENFDLLTKPGPVPSLAELAAVALRRDSSRSEAESLLQIVDWRPKIREYMFLRHVPEHPFPALVFVRDEDSDDDYDDDDDDDFFGHDSDEMDDWGDDYDADVEAFIFFD